MLRKLTLPTLIVLLIAAIGFSACGDDAPAGNSASPTPAPTHTSTPGVPAPDGGPTGIAAVDRAIDSLRARDFPAFKALLLLAPEICAQPGQGSGGPPDCAPGEPVGTQVEVIPAASCEGFWLRESELIQAFNPLFQTTPRLYGVYSASQQLFGRAGNYAVIVDISIPEGPMAANIIMTPDGVVGVNFGCGETGGQMIERGGFTDPVFLPGGTIPSDAGTSAQQ